MLLGRSCNQPLTLSWIGVVGPFRNRVFLGGLGISMRVHMDLHDTPDGGISRRSSPFCIIIYVSLNE